MAIVTFRNYKSGQTRGCMAAVMKYTKREDKVQWKDKRLVTGINCRPDTACEDFMRTKLLYHKEDGVMFYHMVRSFPKGADVDPVTAHAAAIELARYFKDCEVLVCTHTDRDHVHSHCIINSVNFETGKKLHIAEQQLQELRWRNDTVCARFGLPVFEPKQKQKTRPMTIGEYHTAAKGQSWKFRIMGVIDECMRYARTREEFITLMRSEGYDVRWSDTRKYVTYTTPEGDRCRDNKLHEEKYLKENMEHEFGIREEILAGRAESVEQPRPVGGGRGRTAHHADGQELDGGSEPAWQIEFAAACPTGSGHAPADEAGCGGTAEKDRQELAGTASEPDYGGRPVQSTGWEVERSVFLRRRKADLEYGEISAINGAFDREQSAGDDQQNGFADRGVDPRRAEMVDAAGSSVYRGVDGADGTLLRDHTAAVGIGAALGMAAGLNGDGGDPEEARRQIEAKEAAQNLGAALGLIAGVTIAAAEKHRQAEETQQQNQQQSM